MPNFFITDKNGTKHSFNEQQLQALAAKGRITPNTPLESDTGHKGTAGQIPGLFAAPPSPFAQPAQATTPAGSLFCTNCGKPIAEHEGVCMSCGASPTGQRKFCRRCGTTLNPEQTMCINCKASTSATTATGSPKNKLPRFFLLSFSECPVHVGFTLGICQGHLPILVCSLCLVFSP